MELDDLDKKILEILQEDGRASYAEIGRKLNVNENTIRFRISRLIKAGVIRKIVALVDPRMIGINHSAALMLRISPENIDEVLREMTAMREIPHIYQLSGDYDAIAVIMAHDLDGLHQTINKVKRIKGVIEVNSLITIRIVKSDVRYSLV
ncbi:MAG: Lrp/AsnC family transcriptional regulator [Aigarchaeota archaeon]|nr:Lrp/AsnC family transcriptional regulator [Candidatus Pelearchaeum maunauluense]